MRKEAVLIPNKRDASEKQLVVSNGFCSSIHTDSSTEKRFSAED